MMYQNITKSTVDDFVYTPNNVQENKMLQSDANDTRILIVDDDPVSRNLMEGILDPEGYSIVSVADGNQLLERLETFQPDVLLMDVLMPTSNGFDLCRRLKADRHWQHLPIILVTSLNTDAELVQGLDAGADEFISKPVGAAELRARVRSMQRIKQRADLLQRTSQLREDLAHMVVHDLRTPLSVCLMRTDMLLRLLETGKLQMEQREEQLPRYSLRNSLKIIRDQLENMNTQVDDILLMAKTEQDEIVLDYEIADLRSLVHRVIEDHEAIAQRDQIFLQVELPEISCKRRLDINLVHRLINNLVSNALKFSGPKSTITVRLLVREDGRSLQLEVADEGPGIPAEHRERIFDRYEVASTQNKGVRSIGLGLAFCKMVAEAHGGAISVHDNSPRGALFRVTLPLDTELN